VTGSEPATAFRAAPVRRNAAQDGTADSQNPKYLNTGQTPLCTKG